MKRRWFIRCLALLLVAVCSMAWGWSYQTALSIAYGTTTSITSVNSLSGRLFMSSWSDSGVNNQVVGWLTGWHINNGNFGEDNGDAFDGEFDPSTLVGRFGGFALWRKADNSTTHFFAVAIPYWFIESAAVLIAFYAWMKTRPKPNPATAFPVEIKT